MPAPGQTVMGLSYSTSPGGKGANQAAAIGALGGVVQFIGCVGEDAFGDELGEALSGKGVDVSHLCRCSDPTGVAGIVVDDDGENAIVVAAGANSHLSAEHVLGALGGGTGPILVQMEIPGDAIAAALSQKHRLRILNPAPARDLGDLLAGLDFITPNQHEAQLLTGVEIRDAQSCEKTAEALLDRGVRQVIVTLGAKGSYYHDGSRGVIIESIAVTPRDTTGAGDAFNGALAHFLAEGRDVVDAVALANRVGALSTTKVGAQTAMPTMQELRAVAADLL
jgi:ribokinase